MKKTAAPSKKRQSGNDLQDSPADEKKLQPDEATMNLPDVDDIPGQEHVRPPKIRSVADTTISSDDEEGDRILGDSDTDADVSRTEKTLLARAGTTGFTEDEKQLRKAKLDSRDNEGELLNEKSFGDDLSGDDLDVPGSEEDDDNETIGEEDEENNAYSLPDDKD
jgi:hypothetical protein